MTSMTTRAIGLLLFSLFSSLAWGAKTDIVWMKNGDRVTGEVKSLERGLLELKTDHMGTVFIEWEDIEELSSKIGQVVELSNGQRFYGPLSVAEESDMVTVNTEQGAVGLSTEDIVTMYPSQTGFWNRLDVSASLGFSWDKGSSVGKYNLGADAEYRDPRFVTTAAASTEVTTQEGRDDTSRATARANHLVFRRNKRYHAIFGNLERNDELGIDLRGLVGAGYGMVPIRTQRHLLVFGAGLAVNHEIPVEGKSETNLEAVGSFNYDYFRYSRPERSFYTLFTVYPSVTEFGRWRANSDTSLEIEFVKDLIWKMTLYGSYDSDPVSEEASQIDYGVTSSVGYKF